MHKLNTHLLTWIYFTSLLFLLAFGSVRIGLGFTLQEFCSLFIKTEKYLLTYNCVQTRYVHNQNIDSWNKGRQFCPAMHLFYKGFMKIVPRSGVKFINIAAYSSILNRRY
jgi:hypothetical protein